MISWENEQKIEKLINDNCIEEWGQILPQLTVNKPQLKADILKFIKQLTISEYIKITETEL